MYLGAVLEKGLGNAGMSLVAGPTKSSRGIACLLPKIYTNGVHP